jgi:hypothetical protein
VPRQDQEQESPTEWPADTDIVFPPGGTRVMLTLQRPLMRAIIQTAIEELRATLIFSNAFPDGILAMSFIRHCLNVAAEKHCPAALSIRRCLIHDEDYALKISPLGSLPSNVEDHKTDIYSIHSFVPGSLFSAVRSKTSATQLFWPSLFPWHRRTLLSPLTGNIRSIITYTRR